MLSDVYEWLHAPQNWRRCPHTQAVRTCTRTASVAYYLCIQRSRAYPAKLLMLVDALELASEILETHKSHPCLLYPWSKAFLAIHDASESLLGFSSLALLSAVAQSLVTNIYDIVCIHSKHSLRARHRVTSCNNGYTFHPLAPVGHLADGHCLSSLVEPVTSQTMLIERGKDLVESGHQGRHTRKDPSHVSQSPSCALPQLQFLRGRYCSLITNCRLLDVLM